MKTQVTLSQAKQLIFAGNATFTIQSCKTGKHFTYKMVQAKKGANPPHFVCLMTGCDNENHYSFFSTIFDQRTYKYSQKARIAEDTKGVQAFRWFFKHLLINTINDQVKIFHEGRCCRCGRKLTTPESVELGIGPECRKIINN